MTSKSEPQTDATSEELSGVLSEFARTMLTDFPIQRILDHLVKRIVDVMPITEAGVTLIAPGVDPQYVAASNADALRYEQLQTELGEGPCLAAYHTGEAVEVPDLNHESRFPVFVPRALESGLVAVFTFPLRHGDIRLGALDLYRDSAGPLSAAALADAQTLADVAAAYLVNAQARSDLEDSSALSRDASLHDALTGLPNRVLLLERLEHAGHRARRSHKLSIVLFVDLDHFKAINDTYGHRVGDEVLVSVADKLTAVIRPGDTLARLAGDEFVILCEDLADESEADAIVTRVDSALTCSSSFSGNTVDLSASIGVAYTGRGSDAPEQLIHDADLAMYRVKSRNGAISGDLDRDKLHLAESQVGLQRALRGAVRRDELFLEFQPIVATADGRLTGVEALLRWNSESRGLVSPKVLIPLAEHSGDIGEMGRWVLAQAWSDQERWGGTGDGIGTSVNVSAHQLMAKDFVADVSAVLDAASTDPGLLTLELTETAFALDGERALNVLEDLKKVGVRLALDDFGTGSSSLGYLMRFPLDVLKIDPTFVAKIASDPASHTIVDAVIRLAHGLDIEVVGEGVETAEQHHALTELGCNFCQGFYFAPPTDASGIATLIDPGTDGAVPRLPVLTH